MLRVLIIIIVLILFDHKIEVIEGIMIIPTLMSVPTASKPETKLITTSSINKFWVTAPRPLTTERNFVSKESITSERNKNANEIIENVAIPATNNMV